MVARAMWKGTLCLGTQRVPVKLYAAIADRNVHFHLLHDQDMVRLKQRLIDPDTGKTVLREEAREALQLDRELFVVLDDQERAALKPAASRQIEVKDFLETGAIGHQWYDRPYYLGPDGDADSYFALAAALHKQKKEGLAHWVMRKQHYAGALCAEDGHLMLITLRHAGEVIEPSDLALPAGRAFERSELKLAKQLIEALEGDFDPADYRDEYRKRLVELSETKSSGGTVEVTEFEEKPERRSLAQILRASLAKARG